MVNLISERIDPVVAYAELEAARRGGLSDVEAAEYVGVDVLVHTLGTVIESLIAADARLAERFEVLVANASDRPAGDFPLRERS
jgi:hypothetical protein